MEKKGSTRTRGGLQDAGEGYMPNEDAAAKRLAQQIPVSPPINKNTPFGEFLCLYDTVFRLYSQRHTWVAHPTGCANPEYP